MRSCVAPTLLMQYGPGQVKPLLRRSKIRRTFSAGNQRFVESWSKTRITGAVGRWQMSLLLLKLKQHEFFFDSEDQTT